MRKFLFGKNPEGIEIYAYTLSSDDASVEIITKGATITKFTVFGRDIICGFDNLDGYLNDNSYQGALVGRVANRIAGAAFTMDGKRFDLTANNNGNCLHGGVGLSRKIFDVVKVGESSITLSYLSHDGEDGFPADLKVEVTYTLEKTALIIEYTAIPEGKTPISLTNHAYFNLNGFDRDIKNCSAVIYAERYTEVDALLIPTGKRPSVIGTPFDFTSVRTIGERIDDYFTHYDNNFITAPKIFKNFGETKAGLVARVDNGELALNVYTDQNGLQFYVPPTESRKLFKGGRPMPAYGAFCLETQSEPNSVNHGVGFYEKGEAYRHICVYEIERLR